MQRGKYKPIREKMITESKDRPLISSEPHRLDGKNSGFYFMWQGGCLGCVIPIILAILALFLMLRV